MKLDVFVNVAIGELEGSKNYMNEPGRTKLQKAAEKSLEDNINRVIKKYKMNIIAIFSSLAELFKMRGLMFGKN